MKPGTYKGTVLRIMPDRGFGFLAPDGMNDQLFFHVRESSASLPFDATLVERRVEFEAKETEKGWNAVNVRPL